MFFKVLYGGRISQHEPRTRNFGYLDLCLGGLAIGPLILAHMSEQYGRLVVYHTCMIIFLAFTIACAVGKTLTQLTIFRFFAGCSGSAPLAMDGGTVFDAFRPQARGAAMSIWAVGPLLGPVVGPVAGGFLV